jgi:pimeloyl-ACP methyl ester carboxylesterase
MIFLHGFPEFWYSWRKQLTVFSKTHWVVAVDMRGYGDSDKPSGVSSYTTEILSKDVHDMVRALGRDNCILVAHDWGGVVAWHVAMYYPEIVQKLVILNGPHPTAFTKLLRSSIRQMLKSWYVYVFQVPYLPELFFMVDDLEILRESFEGRISEEELEAYKYNWSKQGNLISRERECQKS